MGKKVEITCDGCGNDLTANTSGIDYRLILSSEFMSGYRPNSSILVMSDPPVDREYYFCHLPCLDHWCNRGRHEVALWAAWREDWKQKHGIRYGNFVSYPDIPDDERQSRNLEFRTAALEAFPMKRLPEKD